MISRPARSLHFITLRELSSASQPIGGDQRRISLQGQGGSIPYQENPSRSGWALRSYEDHWQANE